MISYLLTFIYFNFEKYIFLYGFSKWKNWMMRCCPERNGDALLSWFQYEHEYEYFNTSMGLYVIWDKTLTNRAIDYYALTLDFWLFRNYWTLNYKIRNILTHKFFFSTLFSTIRVLYDYTIFHPLVIWLYYHNIQGLKDHLIRSYFFWKQKTFIFCFKWIKFKLYIY